MKWWKYRSLPRGLGCIPCSRQIRAGGGGWHCQTTTLHWHLAPKSLSLAQGKFPEKFCACTWHCHTAYCTKWTQLSSGEGGWGHAVCHIWDQMGLFIRDMDNHHTTVLRLREALLQVWGPVTPERMEVLVRSMPKWLRTVMATGGGHTRY